MNVIIITGASSGMGMEFVKQLDCGFRNVDEFWLIARSRDRLEKLAEELTHKAKVFAMDVTDKSSKKGIYHEIISDVYHKQGEGNKKLFGHPKEI